MTPTGYGFWLFKQYIILETLKSCEFGDIVVYHDCNMSKYAHYKHVVQPDYKKIIIESMKHSDIYAQYSSFKNKDFCKRDVLIRMECDVPEFLESGQAQANVLVMRNTVDVQAIITEWLEWCISPDYSICYEEHDEALRTAYPERNKSFLADEYPTYKAHRHDRQFCPMFCFVAMYLFVMVTALFPGVRSEKCLQSKFQVGTKRICKSFQIFNVG